MDNIKYIDNNKYELHIKLSDFKKIKAPLNKTKTKVHIKKKTGFYPIFTDYKGRICFIIGFILSVTFIFLSSQFIWTVEVVGTENIDEIINVASIAGIRPGAFKHKLPEGNEIKNIILSNTKNYTWSWVYIKGTKAVIKVREAILPPKMIDRKAPCDIVANADGIIQKITVKEGIPHVKKDDVVLKGDLLIGGTYTNKDSTFRLEHALGDVEAITLHHAKRRVKLIKEIRKETGRHKTYIDLKIFSKQIPLYRKININYDNYSIKKRTYELKFGRSHYMGIDVTVNKYVEETLENKPISINEAIAWVEDDMQEEIAKQLLPHSILKSKEITYDMLDESNASIKLSMQFTEKIGAEIPINLPPSNNEITKEKQE